MARSNAAAMLAREADDARATQDNQPALHELLAGQLARLRELGSAGPVPTTHETIEKRSDTSNITQHGQITVRRCSAAPAVPEPRAGGTGAVARRRRDVTRGISFTRGLRPPYT